MHKLHIGIVQLNKITNSQIQYSYFQRIFLFQYKKYEHSFMKIIYIYISIKFIAADVSIWMMYNNYISKP